MSKIYRLISFVSSKCTANIFGLQVLQSNIIMLKGCSSIEMGLKAAKYFYILSIRISLISLTEPFFSEYANTLYVPSSVFILATL